MSLLEQSHQDFELILIDDHSSDQTRTIMELELKGLRQVKIIEADGFGKKKALKQGILAAQGSLIITTDADCIPNKSWIETIIDFYCQNPCDLIIGPVKLKGDGTIFSNLQELEFATLVASGAGAAGIKRPILCNAANLAFTKQAWLENQGALREDLISGDDIFLLESIKRRGGKILFLKSTAAFVSTRPAKNITDFVKQRQRWASKAPAYTDWMLIFTSCTVLSINFIILSTCIAASFKPENWKPAVLLIGVKYITDLFFISSVRKFFSLRHIVWLSAILTTVYPFYIVLVAGKSLLFKPKWR